jgi:predicted metal-dependent hydrolase
MTTHDAQNELDTQYDPLYVAFLYHFNLDRDYFECHEVMEQLWLEMGRLPYYQGLLQVAVGLYHHRNGNIEGGIKLLSAAIRKLEASDQQIMGIDMAKLIHDARDHLHQLERHAEYPFEFRDLTIIIQDLTLLQLVESYCE